MDDGTTETLNVFPHGGEVDLKARLGLDFRVEGVFPHGGEVDLKAFCGWGGNGFGGVFPHGGEVDLKVYYILG